MAICGKWAYLAVGPLDVAQKPSVKILTRPGHCTKKQRLAGVFGPLRNRVVIEWPEKLYVSKSIK